MHTATHENIINERRCLEILKIIKEYPLKNVNIIINTRISRRVTIVTQCHNCDALCHNCDILFVKMLELGSEIIPKN